MKNEVKFPYGVSDFSKLVLGGFHYIDRTQYIENIEKSGEPYLFFFRPRRFGKSLILSMLMHYYGREHKDNFEALFGKYYIGQHRSEKAGSYLILRFDFSGIDTRDKELTFTRFLQKVKAGVLDMMSRYPDLFSEEDRAAIEARESPSAVVEKLYLAMQANRVKEKMYVLIDEYDHFTNELMAFRIDEFMEIVSRNGYVRKFFEMLKEGAGTGFVDRMFATGVSPVTLDSLTSGFNIGRDISRRGTFSEMAGFTETEILALLRLLPLQEPDSPENLLTELEKWYDGYRFSFQAVQNLYNPALALFFCSGYLEAGSFPEELLDTNLSSDYGKIRRMFQLREPERNYQVLREIVENRQVKAQLTKEFSFEKPFSRDDFVSLLYYLGQLTLAPSQPNFPVFKVPNYVVEKLFFDYFFHLLEEREKVPLATDVLRNAMEELALQGNPRPFFDFIQNILQHLSRRDYQEFTEKHLKVIILATALQSEVYFVKSEREVLGGYTDIQFLQRPGAPVHSQYVFELKYLKKQDAAQLPLVQKEAKKQLAAYLETEPELGTQPNLRAWTIVVVKDEIKLEQVR